LGLVWCNSAEIRALQGHVSSHKESVLVSWFSLSLDSCNGADYKVTCLPTKSLAFAQGTMGKHWAPNYEYLTHLHVSSSSYDT
jgi:hypothetical protein